jgi:hypothetical protein
MIMFRIIFAIVSSLLVVTITVSCDEHASFPSLGGDKCSELDDVLAQCILSAKYPNADYDGDFSMVNTTACGQCEIEYGLYEISEPLTCAEATEKVCSYFNQCGRLCFPKHTICAEEATKSETCSYGKHLAPPDCIITCDSAVLDGRGMRKRSGGSNYNNKKDNDVDDKKNKVSGAMSTSVITLSGMVSMMLVVVSFS